MSNKNNFYINKVSLRGFRTVKDIEISLNSGFNVIIGKNAVGKTNFLTFLYKVLKFDYNKLAEFYSLINFNGNKQFSIHAESYINIDDINKNKSLIKKFYGKLICENNDLEFNQNNIEELKMRLNESDCYYRTTFIKHGIPDIYPIVKDQFSFSISKDNKIPNALFNLYNDENTSNFINPFIFDLIVKLINLNNEDTLGYKVIDVIDSVFTKLENIKIVLSTYSPIKDIRLSPNCTITDNTEEILISNIYLEFFIDGQWLPFSSLSDGTKRVFYIISEVYSLKSSPIQNIFLIEEPELGIHPHQFDELLKYLNEQSIYSQIIITTHSPQSLNILSEDDLNRIILAGNIKNKTTLRHLNDNELSKACDYLENEYLSDYWLYSDLEA